MSATISSWGRGGGRSARETTPVNRRARKATRRAALLAGIVGAVMVTGVPGVAGSAPAVAQTAPEVTGLVTVTASVDVEADPDEDEPVLRSVTATAVCPSGKKVVGGGGWALTDNIAEEERLTLTRLLPFDAYYATGYIAEAAETAPGVAGGWGLQAYALCADASSLRGWNINEASTVRSSRSVQATAVGCDNSGQRVIGTGAAIRFGSGKVGLQVARMSGPGDIARAQGHENPYGYSGGWSVTAYAICADIPSGYQVVDDPSDEPPSNEYKFAYTTCPSGKQMLSAGAATSNVAPGNATLQVVYPGNDHTWMQALAWENTPTSEDWDFIIARGVCVNKR